MTTSILVVVTTELVSRPDDIAALIQSFKGCDVHQQLLERLETLAVTLPRNNFDRVHIATLGRAPTTLSGQVCEALWASLKPQATLDGDIDVATTKAHLLIAGFAPVDTEPGVWKKVGEFASSASLKRPSGYSSGKKRQAPLFKRVEAPANPQVATPPSSGEDGDELIDEDALVADLAPAIQFPAKCDPGPGRKRRRACKDCTCGLKEQEEQENDAARAKQNAVILNDVAEIDFTVPGKAVGGCGSCALGDAFRCDGCPYLGLPPFKPGEVVSIDQFGDEF